MKTASRHLPAPVPRAAARPLTVSAGPELLRRALLGLVVALLVARPLVMGEDPGLTDHLSDASNLVLTLLWFVAAAGWAVWRGWSGQTKWRGSLVEAFLLGVVVCVFISASGAAYKHPAWLIAWEWGGFLVVFCLVRQLFRTPAEDRRLLAALLAGAVCLGAQALHQYTVELPAMRKSLGTGSGGTLNLKSDSQKLRDKLASIGVALEPDDPQLKAWDDRFHENNVFATFAHPNAFAGYLALLLPGAVAAAAVCWKRKAGRGRNLLAVACALLVAMALWLTHSRGGVLGTILIGLIALVVMQRRWLWRRKWYVAAALVLVIVAGWALLRPGAAGSLSAKARDGLAKAEGSLSLRRDYWEATWKMIRDHGWRGVGPGNFSEYYPRYMLMTAYEKIKDPHNFALEMWSTCGVVAMAALLLALAGFFWHISRGLLRAPRPETEEAEPEAPTVRPEFYLGGMAGLILAYVLWASGQTGPNAADSLLVGGVAAGLRAVIWFAAFAVLEQVPWTKRWFVLGLTAGVGALLLNLLVSGGISASSIAQPLWAIAALALNGLAAPLVTTAGRPSWLKVAVPIPLAFAVLAIYVDLCFYPVVSAAATVNDARMHGSVYFETLRAAGPASRGNYDYLRNEVIKPLKEAIARDPGDIAPRLELMHWYEERFAAHETRWLQDQEMIALVKEAETLDPEGSASYLTESEMWQRFASRQDDASGMPTAESAPQYAKAAQALAEVVRRDPTEARLHYELGILLLKAGKRKDAMLELRIAYECHKQSKNVLRRLTEGRDGQVARLLLLVNMPPAP